MLILEKMSGSQQGHQESCMQGKSDRGWHVFSAAHQAPAALPSHDQPQVLSSTTVF